MLKFSKKGKKLSLSSHILRNIVQISNISTYQMMVELVGEEVGAVEEVVAVEAVEALLVPMKIVVSSSKNLCLLFIIFNLYI